MTHTKNKLLDLLRTRRDSDEEIYRAMVRLAAINKLPDDNLSDFVFCVEAQLIATGRTFEDFERDVNTFLQRN